MKNLTLALFAAICCACFLGADPIPLPLPQNLAPEINQILPAVYDAANSALRVEYESGGAGNTGPSDANQVMGAVYDSANSALRIECLTGCGGSGGGSTTIETNGTPNGSQTLFNLIAGAGVSLSDASGTGNVTIGFSATFPATQSSTSNEWLNSYNSSTGAFTASQPSFANLSGTATLAQLPAIPFTNLTGTATLSQLPSLSFSNLAGTISATQLAASPVTNDCIGYSGAALEWLGCGGGSGSSSWSALTAPSANLSLSMGTYTSQWTYADGKYLMFDAYGDLGFFAGAATSTSGNIDSPNNNFNSSYWNGTASANDNWNFYDACGTGTAPTCDFLFEHSGSSGGGSLVAPSFGTDGGGSGVLTLSGSTSGSAGISVGATAGTPSTWLMPTTDPTNGEVLTASAPSGGLEQLGWGAAGSGGSTAWSSLGVPTANLTLSNGAYDTTFDQTSAAAWEWANTTAATSSANQSSPVLNLCGNVWTGSASAPDCWSLAETLASGTEASSALLITQTGSTGLYQTLSIGSSMQIVPTVALDRAALLVRQASGDTQDLLDLDQTGSVNVFKVTHAGAESDTNLTDSALTSGDLVCTSTGGLLTTSGCPAGGSITLQTNGTNNATQTTLNLAAGTGVSLANSGGTVTINSTASGSGLPSSWAVNGTTNAVTAQPLSGQDAVPLTVAPNDGGLGTSDIFDVCSTVPCSSGTKFFAIQSNGNAYLYGNELGLGVVDQASPSWLNLPGGVGVQPDVELETGALEPPAITTANLSTATTGGSLPASTQYCPEITFLSASGETTPSNYSCITTGSGTATNTVTVTLPTVSPGATGWNVYANVSGDTAELQNSTPIPIATTTYTFGSIASGLAAPSANASGAATKAFLSLSAEGNGVLCSSSVSPSADCGAGTNLLQQQNLIAGANVTITPANNGTGDVTIASSGGASLSAANTWTAAQTFAGDILCDSQRPCVDVVAEGADPTGTNASDAAFTAAEAAFNGKNGGTIVGCGIFRLTQPWIITNPGLRIKSNCGDAGTSLQGVQRGGFVLESTTNSAIPNQTTAPTLSASTTGGSLAAGTYDIETTLVNGFGQTAPGPSASVTTTGSTGSIAIKGIQYESGGWAYNVYCSTAGTAGTFYEQTSSNFSGATGTNAGPPFLVGTTASNSESLVLTSCTTSGTTAPTSNTSTDANSLIQVGTMATEVSGGPEFDNVYFYDPDHVLGAGLVIVAAQRTMCFHCSWEGFTANGTAIGGEAPYEQGGIGYAVLDDNTSSNFNSLVEPEFYTDNLAMLLLGSDTTIWGGDVEVDQSGTGADQVGFDYAAGGTRMYGTHFSLNESATASAGIIRGNSRAAHYGGIFSIKTEQAAGATVLKLQDAENMQITQQCEGNSSTTCLTLDSNSNYNVADIAAVPDAVAFSDGTTPYNDPTKTNIITVGGFAPGVYAPSYKVSATGGTVSITGGSGAPTGSCNTGSIYSNTSGGSGSTLYVCVSGSWADVK